MPWAVKADSRPSSLATQMLFWLSMPSAVGEEEPSTGDGEGQGPVVGGLGEGSCANGGVVRIVAYDRSDVLARVMHDVERRGEGVGRHRTAGGRGRGEQRRCRLPRPYQLLSASARAPSLPVSTVRPAGSVATFPVVGFARSPASRKALVMPSVLVELAPMLLAELLNGAKRPRCCYRRELVERERRRGREIAARTDGRDQ